MFIQKGKTNWIFIIVVALIAGAVGGGLTVYINDTINQTTSLSQIAELTNPVNNGGNGNNQTNNSGNAANEGGKTNLGADFNLVFKYGVGGKNVLDTFKNKFTKDMIADPAVTVDFRLTQAEKESIRQKINELDLFNKTSKIQPQAGIQMAQTPCSNYYLKVQESDLAKEVSWDDCAGKITEVYQQFSSFMINLIESKKEFKDLPAAKGGYL